MRVFAIIIGLLWGLFLTAAVAHAGSATSTLSVIIQGQFGVTFTPPNPSISCTAPIGTVVAAINVVGGDGNPVTISMTGSTDFALTATSLPSNVVVNNNGIPATDCGKTVNVTITATQN